MEDGTEVPVFRMEYGINRGSVWDEMVSYILTDFKISKRSNAHDTKDVASSLQWSM